MQGITLNVNRNATISLDQGRIHIQVEDGAPPTRTSGSVTLGTSETPPAIGQFWRGQGGVYAGLMRGAEGKPDYHLIVATAHVGNLANLKWGGYGSEVKGATSDTDGLANTQALLADSEGHPVLDVIRGLNVEGHTDFYLPARRELSLCFANVRELFETDDWFWSSTQDSANDAWYQRFNDGLQYWLSKYDRGRARAVRRVPA